MLLRFRLGQYACIADIERAFLQITLAEEDRDVTRFFWPKDPMDPHSTWVMYRFRVVLFGATCSQFLLNATIQHHLQANDSSLARSILRNIYVDNLHHTADEEEDLIAFYEGARDVLGRAGLNLREWASNSPQLNSQAQADEVGSNKTVQGVLGLNWEPTTDIINYNTPRSEGSDRTTKREVLRFISRVYDPLGWILPVTIRARLFMQELWKSQVTWDEPIASTQTQEEWQKLASDLKEVSSKMTLSRWIQPSGGQTLHIFADASMKAYGAVAYLVGGNETHLVMAKARVAPLRAPPTLPQLELTAALVAARVGAFIMESYRDELRFDTIHIWSDSQITLDWIHSEKPLKPYVKNRTNEIQQLMPKAMWHYCPTEDNPADLLTRGMSARAFLTS